MNPRPDETEIVGRWVQDAHGVRADEACARIETLTTKVFRKLAVSKTYGEWETLFEDPADGRLWERTYPNAEMHGGGPPHLAVISPEQARLKYHVP